jgi:hypothetical protein
MPSTTFQQMNLVFQRFADPVLCVSLSSCSRLQSLDLRGCRYALSSLPLLGGGFKALEHLDLYYGEWAGADLRPFAEYAVVGPLLSLLAPIEGDARRGIESGDRRYDPTTIQLPLPRLQSLGIRVRPTAMEDWMYEALYLRLWNPSGDPRVSVCTYGRWRCPCDVKLQAQVAAVMAAIMAAMCYGLAQGSCATWQSHDCTALSLLRPTCALSGLACASPRTRRP